MTKARIMIEFLVPKNHVGGFTQEILRWADALVDSYRCPSLSLVGELRCELEIDHSGDRHRNGTTSWPKDSVPPATEPPKVGSYWKSGKDTYRVVHRDGDGVQLVNVDTSRRVFRPLSFFLEHYRPA